MADTTLQEITAERGGTGIDRTSETISSPQKGGTGSVMMTGGTIPHPEKMTASWTGLTIDTEKGM